MERFIHNENLKLWRRQLRGKEVDPPRLIAKEEAREAEIETLAKAKSER
jgi:hypothetical protein